MIAFLVNMALNVWILVMIMSVTVMLHVPASQTMMFWISSVFQVNIIAYKTTDAYDAMFTQHPE